MRDLIDPMLLPGLELIPPLTLSDAALPAIREGFAQMAAMMPEPEGTGIAWADTRVATPAGHEIGARVYTPEGAAGPLPAILHIHGGGYVVGSVASNHLATLGLAAATGAVVVSVDYRLAPETQGTGAVEDCHAALIWLHDEAARLGVDPARIAVRGESAGGGLAAALALLVRDRGGPAIVHQNLIYPMLDDRTCIAAPPPHLGAFGWRALLGRAPGSGDVSPYEAPARAEDLAGLPPAFIAVGALDLFLAEDLDYARRLAEARVPVETHVYPRAFHGFDVVPDAPVVQRMKHAAVAALRAALHPA